MRLERDSFELSELAERWGGNGGAKLCHGSGVMVALRAE
jgi:hypothetical protein